MWARVRRITCDWLRCGKFREPQAGALYTEKVTAPNASHVIGKNLSILSALSLTSSSGVAALARASGPTTTAIAPAAAPLHRDQPGAAWPNKRWPPDGLAPWPLRARSDRPTSLVTWGPDKNCRTVVGAGQDHPPPPSVSDLAVLMREAALSCPAIRAASHCRGDGRTTGWAVWSDLAWEQTDRGSNDVVISARASGVLSCATACGAPGINEITLQEVIAASEQRLVKGLR